MIAEAIQKSVLEWLQLTPELLSGLPRRAKAAVQPAAPPVAEASPVAAITSATVLPSVAMSFIQPPPAPSGEGEVWQQVIAQSYPAQGRAYASPESGGTQRAALTEMTGYLTTRLQPPPSRAG